MYNYIDPDPFPLVYEAPTKNVTVPLGQTQLVKYYCSGKGNIQWLFNETIFNQGKDKPKYEAIGVVFYPERSIYVQDQGRRVEVVNISFAFNASTANQNNSQVSCGDLNGYDGTIHRVTPPVWFVVAGNKINVIVKK